MKKGDEVNITLQQFKKLIKEIERQGLKVYETLDPTLNLHDFRRQIHVKFVVDISNIKI